MSLSISTMQAAVSNIPEDMVAPKMGRVCRQEKLIGIDVIFESTGAVPANALVNR